ncbi:MAG: prepilin peptidase [Bdellovibrio sp.]|nr:prepilin peptidase [Bdellovibrio sp.]
MYGPIDPVAGLILGVALVAMTTDLWRGKIYNWLTVSTMAVGLGMVFYLAGWGGLLQSLMGIGLGLALYGWIFWFGFMGAGDVKLLMALGAIGGTRYIEEVALLALICGGAMSILLLLLRGKLVPFIKKIYLFLLSLFVAQLEVQFPKLDRSVSMPFGVAIAVASVWVYFGHPLLRTGWVLWP